MDSTLKENFKPSDFFQAVKHNDVKMVKAMLKERMMGVNDVDMSDPTRPSAIIIATELGHFDMVQFLMKAKPKPADVNFENAIQKRAMWFASKNGELELVKQLLSKNSCDVNFIDKETGCTPLYRAIVCGNAPIARELVHAGANVNIRRLGYDVGAETPLIKAVQMDNIEICDLLINSLCKIHAKTDQGLTALHYAVAYRRYKICELLLKSGCKVHAKSNHGVTPMTVAIEQHNPCMVKTLIEFGYKLDKAYSWGETSLEQAIKLHSYESALTLLHWGCSLKRKRKQCSYFYLAVNEKQWPVVRFLIHLNPQYLQESWLRTDAWPVALYRRHDVRCFLMESASSVWSLKQLCRAKVFRLVGKYAPVRMEKLPLPSLLKEYLKFNEHVKENFYDERPLEKIECPFDCKAMCDRRDCPDLDISISSDTDSEFEV